MNILITGVSKGLGLVTVKLLLVKGYTIYGISRSKSDELNQLLLDYNAQLNWLSYDLSNTNDIRNQIFKNWIGFDTSIDAYINNAAFAYDDIITNMNIEALEKMYRINVFSPLIIAKFAIRQMILHKTKGSIVHVSSISAHTGYKGLAMYASSKGALEAFSKNTAREWGEKGIRSNCLVAGFMETDMSAKLSSDQKKRIYNRTSLKKGVDVESVANTISFLVSNDSKSITGENIFVTNGTI